MTESEYATDAMFKSPAALARLYPALVQQGIQHFGSTDVLRFLGHKTRANGRVHGNHQGEVLSRRKRRPEGLRLKHQANGSYRYQLTRQGRQIVTALLAARQADVEKLMAMVA